MSREFKIGLFMGVAILILATFIFIVGDIFVVFKKSGYPLLVSFDSASGLEKKAVVRLAGVKIGFVKDIQLSGRKAEVTLDISSEFKVPKDSKATMASLGLLGERYIEIVPGDEEGFCQPGDTIEGMPSVSFDQMGTLLLGIGEEIKEVGKSLRGIASEETRVSIRDILQDLSGITEDLGGFIEENRGDLRAGIKGASQAARNIDLKVNEVSSSLQETLRLVKDIAGENRENIRVNLERIKDLITKMEDSLRSLSESLEKINRGEGTLGRLVQNPGLYEEVEATIEEVKSTLRPLRALRASFDFRTDYLGKSEDLKSYLTVSLQVGPRSFFLGQVVRDPRQDRFTYTAEGGFRWRDVFAHAGVIESEFGGGVGYLTFDDRLAVNLESFNFNRQPGPHFRLSAKYFPSTHLYLVLGVDDFSVAKKREVFFGLGFGR